MLEITNGLFELFKKSIAENSFLLAAVYTIGHVFIAAITVKLVTGANWFDAGMVALIEPTINGVWFYVLHKLYKTYKGIT